ncbi:DUF7680 family protein [Tautonia rosea]|uniref:DUF7680 family protein n=1 Tax=Tautonia rosea TaxID=2728037 RepID=UPI0014764D12|nr:hypothetical protein [Tautonia rosea]
MERFRLRVRQEARRGQIWELHLFPNMPGRLPREADAKVMGSSASPETIQWLRELSDPFLQEAEDPGPIAACDFRPGTPARWLRHADGMRLALAFTSARYLTRPAQRAMFRSGLLELPSEVVLYWFTLCFYGYRQQAGRAALRTLLTYEQPDEGPAVRTVRGRKNGKGAVGPTLFDIDASEVAAAGPAEGKNRSRAKKRTTSSR